ncbi:diacylglycerol kinase family protein [Mucilaginibacter sp. cycad4]|uniref:diacylglycerol kinase family protein n=1 Tax=Mucilaginibacter sp. cycad4 TaxID=3342096 RepID=UPI002AAB7474|nr:diacylglycerol kinase family protein [Mucilaginibacter gossypii]WPU98627.1 diacylglycerol kinase family protein [Mucilaginibacter gossypii]
MKRLVRSFGFAFKGLGYAVKTQPNFRFHLVAGTIAVALGFFLKLSTAEWLWLMACITVVLVTELLNTSLETLTDLVSPTYNEKAGHVKDIAAGAVVVAALFALITGIVIFLPKIILLIRHAA